MIIVCVAVAAVVIVAAVAFVMSNSNNNKELNATELAENFVKEYDGDFGKFTIVDGATESQAILTYTAQQQKWDGTKIEDTRTMNILIKHYDSEDQAAKEFDKYATDIDPPYNAKNGKNGLTIVSLTSQLGMAKLHPTVLNGSKNLQPAEGATIKTVKASTYGADQIYVLYAGYDSGYKDSQQFSQFSMVLQDGKDLIIINQSSKNEYSMYINETIKESSEVKSGEVYMTVAEFEKELLEFCKAF